MAIVFSFVSLAFALFWLLASVGHAARSMRNTRSGHVQYAADSMWNAWASATCCTACKMHADKYNMLTEHVKSTWTRITCCTYHVKCPWTIQHAAHSSSMWNAWTNTTCCTYHVKCTWTKNMLQIMWNACGQTQHATHSMRNIRGQVHPAGRSMWNAGGHVQNGENRMLTAGGQVQHAVHSMRNIRGQWQHGAHGMRNAQYACFAACET